jgi:hypothetical protein
MRHGRSKPDDGHGVAGISFIIHCQLRLGRRSPASPRGARGCPVVGPPRHSGCRQRQREGARAGEAAQPGCRCDCSGTTELESTVVDMTRPKRQTAGFNWKPDRESGPGPRFPAESFFSRWVEPLFSLVRGGCWCIYTGLLRPALQIAVHCRCSMQVRSRLEASQACVWGVLSLSHHWEQSFCPLPRGPARDSRLKR